MKFFIIYFGMKCCMSAKMPNALLFRRESSIQSSPQMLYFNHLCLLITETGSYRCESWFIIRSHTIACKYNVLYFNSKSHKNANGHKFILYLTHGWLIGKSTNEETANMLTFQEAEIRARIIKAMAHPVRLMIVDVLKNGECSFSALFELFKLDKSTVSKHLLVLKEAGIVSSRKDGMDMIYQLDVPCITDFFNCVTAVIENKVMKHEACLCRK